MASSNSNHQTTTGRSDARNANDHHQQQQDEEETSNLSSIHDISLLEGASVLLPDRPMGLYDDDDYDNYDYDVVDNDCYYPDDISSLNSSIYRPEHSLVGFITNSNSSSTARGGGDLRIVGRHDDGGGGGGGGMGEEGPVLLDGDTSSSSLQKNDSRETKDTTTYSRSSHHSDPNNPIIQRNNNNSQNRKRGCCCCCTRTNASGGVRGVSNHHHHHNTNNWYHRSPNWLQIVVMLSVALLVGSAVLVAVGVTLALRDNSSSTAAASGNGSNNNNNSNQEYSPTAPEFSTLPPQQQQQDGDDDDELIAATATTTPAPPPTFAPPSRIRSPTVSPAPQTTVAPSAPSPTATPSASPTIPIDWEVLKFYVTAGRYGHELLQNAPANLQKLPSRGGTSFLVHLGDWNNPDDTTSSSSSSSCDESSFQQVVDLYQNSAVPVYFVVGDKEFTDCSDPEQAMELWKNNLVGYETRYWEEPDWDLWRQGQGHEENFAFDYMDAAFASINLVDEEEEESPEQGDDIIASEFEFEYELDERLQANLDWIDDLYKDYKKRANVFFIFCNAGPKSDGPNKLFFDALFEQIETRYAQMRFVLVHQNGSQPERYGIEKNYNEIENLDVISVLGPIWPPLEITVNTREKDPSKAVSISLHEWYDAL